MRLFSFAARRNALLVVTGLIVAYVRNFLQYHRYSFESVWEFLGFWFVHYVAVALTGALFYALLSGASRFFVEEPDADRELSMARALVFFCVAVVICSASIFLIAHWPAGAAEGFQE